MTNLFKKAAIFTDIHFGKKSNDRQFNIDCEHFVKWFIKEATNENVDAIIFCGDFFDNRHAIHISTLNYALSSLEMLNSLGIPIYMIPGNHDEYYKDKREISSIAVGRNLENIHIFNDMITISNVTFCPWLVGTEWKQVSEYAAKSSYVFGHFELPRFMMNAMVEMPDTGGLNADHFNDVEFMAFSGHFHKRQIKNKVCYVGSPFPHDYSDAWDDDRGMMILEWGNAPEFRKWPDAPSYKTMKLSELLENPTDYIDAKTSARVTTDLDISYEEIQFIKETFISTFGARKFDITNVAREREEMDFSEEVEFQSVDQIVIEGLKAVDSLSFDSNLLIKLYRDL